MAIQVHLLASLMVKMMEQYLVRKLEISMVYYLGNHLESLKGLETVNYLVLWMANMMGYW